MLSILVKEFSETMSPSLCIKMTFSFQQQLQNVAIREHVELLSIT